MPSYSVAATVFRATTKDRKEFRKLGMTSGDATKEFAATFDLTTLPLPTFPLVIPTPNITQITFLVIQATGGTATVRIAKSSFPFQTIDIDVKGTVLLSGVSLQSVLMLGSPTNGVYVEIWGMGK